MTGKAAAQYPPPPPPAPRSQVPIADRHTPPLRSHSCCTVATGGAYSAQPASPTHSKSTPRTPRAALPIGASPSVNARREGKGPVRPQRQVSFPVRINSTSTLHSSFFQLDLVARLAEEGGARRVAESAVRRGLTPPRIGGHYGRHRRPLAVGGAPMKLARPLLIVAVAALVLAPISASAGGRGGVVVVAPRSSVVIASPSAVVVRPAPKVFVATTPSVFTAVVSPHHFFPRFGTTVIVARPFFPIVVSA